MLRSSVCGWLDAWQTDVIQEVHATFAVEYWEFLAILPCSGEDGLDKKE